MEGIKVHGSTTEILLGEKQTGRTESRQTEVDTQKLEKVCAEFEAIFINCMLKTMRNAIPQSGAGFPGKDIYSGMVDRKVAENLAEKGGGIGLQEMLLRHLTSEITG